MGVGLAQGAYDLALGYAKEREQFGKPISSFQAIQFSLADMATEIEAGRALVQRGGLAEGRRTTVRARGRDGEALHRRAVGTGRGAALQIHGGYGYMEEAAISRLYRDQKILEIGEGTNEVQRMVIARHRALNSPARQDVAMQRLCARLLGSAAILTLTALRPRAIGGRARLPRPDVRGDGVGDERRALAAERAPRPDDGVRAARPGGVPRGGGGTRRRLDEPRRRRGARPGPAAACRRSRARPSPCGSAVRRAPGNVTLERWSATATAGASFWPVTLVVVPADEPSEQLGVALVVGLVGLLGLTIGAAFLWRRTSRPLQEK